ncbi:hypothetical protein SAMN05216249_101102 [Acetitomaculum ruminis DSM 5522]|uniref:Uncharacterized protein n=1 Tax=Acetitomaculum ruminis DSM 5522 TaxID=1120918 RepID=A0A1I0V209_9FIRM|nr:hypothetical protein [Acetitomaculum ruminis]SFA70067.1 hypothetical protein SAMN05216249_101102 [Acetitomaculum ruminis DSM 5522]
MTNANTFNSMIIVLLMFMFLYFLALGVYETIKIIQKRKYRKALKSDGVESSCNDKDKNIM